MNHFVLTIPVCDDDVNVIKTQLRNYVEECGDIAIAVVSESEISPSPELQTAVRNMFLALMLTINHSDFERIQ